MGDFLHNVQLDVRDISLVVDVEESYSALLLCNDSVCCYDSCASRLSSSLGGDGHSYFAYTRREFCSLQRIVKKLLLEIIEIISKAPVTLFQPLKLCSEIR